MVVQIRCNCGAGDRITESAGCIHRRKTVTTFIQNAQVNIRLQHVLFGLTPHIVQSRHVVKIN